MFLIVGCFYKCKSHEGLVLALAGFLLQMRLVLILSVPAMLCLANQTPTLAVCLAYKGKWCVACMLA
jgi:hypothetical protein